MVNKHLSIGIPSLTESSPVCPCGQNHDFFGYHRLNCKQNAGRANRAAHDLQFRAICYRQTSARIGHAVAKASVMRLLGVPRLPLPHLIPSYALARNRPGPADSFSPSLPHTYASSLGSLPSPASLSFSSAPSP